MTTVVQLVAFALAVGAVCHLLVPRYWLASEWALLCHGVVVSCYAALAYRSGVLLVGVPALTGMVAMVCLLILDRRKTAAACGGVGLVIIVAASPMWLFYAFTTAAAPTVIVGLPLAALRKQWRSVGTGLASLVFVIPFSLAGAGLLSSPIFGGYGWHW